MIRPGSRLRALKAPVLPDAPLQPLARDAVTALQWRQPRWDQDLYRLESSHGLHALMHSVGIFDSKTTFQSAAGSYRLESGWTGVLRLHHEGESQPRCTYRPGWWHGGKLVLQGGESLSWKSCGLASYQIETEDGFPLVGFSGSKEWFKGGSELTLHDATWRRDDVLELVMLGFAALCQASRRASY